jgi:phosphatidylinositol N-acetylglucosaminyltransferase subunit A
MQVLKQGSIFLNTSLTESFGIAILEAACAGLYVVSTRVGGVPEILPEDMISFTAPTADGTSPISFGALPTNLDLDVFRAMSEAIAYIQEGEHDPHHAHQKIRGFYDWGRVADRTEVVYREVLATPPYPLWTRIQRCAIVSTFLLYTKRLRRGHFPGPWVWVHLWVRSIR